MKLRKALDVLFGQLHEEKIDYCILRDYETIEMINDAEDIDISVSEEHREKATHILLSQGWKTPTINPNRFGHEQFFRWDQDKIIKIDILWGISFDNGKYRFNSGQQIYDTVDCLEDSPVHIPAIENGLYLLVLHVALDKHQVSRKNMIQIKRLYKEKDTWASRTAKEILDQGKEELFKYEADIHELITDGDITETDNTEWVEQRKQKLLQWSKATRKINVAIIGVDGTGKSALIKSLKEYYGDKVHIQYMGFRSFETLFARLFAGRRRIRIPFRRINAFFYYLSSCHEMRYRLRKSRRNSFVIFDRYGWEAYDNALDAFSRRIAKTLFVDHFPVPQGLIYLHCPADISLQRKNDIADQCVFVSMKERFDKTYLHREDICAIDTYNDTIEEVKAKAIEYICLLSQGKYL